jgi:hypothetical protein
MSKSVDTAEYIYSLERENKKLKEKIRRMEERRAEIAEDRRQATKRMFEAFDKSSDRFNEVVDKIGKAKK